MTARTLSWSAGAQARRIMAVDARITGIDAAYALLYVLAGFFLPMPDAKREVYVVVGPFVTLSITLLYLAGRICGPDREEKTAMFYANLPRERTWAFWTHAAWLGLFALAMEVVIVVAVALRFNAARPDQPFIIAPYMFVLPFFAAASWMWSLYGLRRRIFFYPAALAAGIGLIKMFIWDFMLRDAWADRLAITRLQNLGPALALVLLTGAMLWHGSWRWKIVQVGEWS